MKKCYFQGCQDIPVTVEHAPPKSFFPKDKRKNLITVPSCTEHNNVKSNNDIYVLAQVTMNSSPRNNAQSIFMKSIAPQLEYNQEALRKILADGSRKRWLGGWTYKVDGKRIDDFFDALCFAIYAKFAGEPLPKNYRVSHVYHNLKDCKVFSRHWMFKIFCSFMYKYVLKKSRPEGQVKCENESVYISEIFGLHGRPLTITHVFYGHFQVSSFLTPSET